MSDPNTTPPPHQGGPGGPADSPGFPPPSAPPPAAPPSAPPPPGQFPHFPQAPLQTPAQAYSQWAQVEGWVPELGVRIATAGTRIGAKAIDIVLYLVIQTAIGLTLSLIWLTGDTDAANMSSSSLFVPAGAELTFSIVSGLVLLGIDLLYNVACTARFGGTPGKLMVGIKVVYQDGRTIDLRGAFVRFSPVAGLIVLGMVPIVGLFAALARLGLLIANLVLVIVDERRKDVFDRIASTYVISSR